MATKSTSKKSDSSAKAADQRQNKNVAPKTQQTTSSNPEKQSQLATILVGLLIIASGLLVYNYFQKTSSPDTTSQNQQQQQEDRDASEAKNESEDVADDKTPANTNEGSYTVMPGDSLWSIAEKVYGDGFAWNKILDANNIALNAYGQPTVEIGQKLTIPDSAARTTADADLDTEDEQEKQVAGIQEVNEMPSTAIETHTVAPGESLWSIAEQYYGEGGQWFIIAEDEHNDVGLLENGRPLVHVGDVLVVPSIN